jgi:hypothetical protein
MESFEKPAPTLPEEREPARPARLFLFRPSPQAAEAERAVPAWSPGERLLFRFVFSYLLLYNLPFPLDFIPYVDAVAGQYEKLWRALVPWVGRQVFQVSITVFPNGSGDTTYNYVQVACFLAIATAATVLWTLLDRRWQSYARLHLWLRVFVRFSLAAAMVSYGAVKVIKSQFPDPGLARLVQPYGDSSPMGLLWTFMGASASYNLFSGAAEVLGGLLLTLRRTTLLGALVSAAVMLNVVMLNFSYDVPVKLYSLHLLAMALFLAAPSFRRLADFFLFNRPVAPAMDRPLFGRAWSHRAALALRTVLVVALLAFMLHRADGLRRQYGDLAKKPPLYGIWNVDAMAVDGTVRPPLTTDLTRWRRVIFDSPGAASIQLMNDSRKRYNVELDPRKRTIELSPRLEPNVKHTLSYKRSGPEALTLEGTFERQRVRAELRRVPEPAFLLLTRGFHWINEYPFNR